jgi:hypothetical protein
MSVFKLFDRSFTSSQNKIWLEISEVLTAVRMKKCHLLKCDRHFFFYGPFKRFPSSSYNTVYFGDEEILTSEGLVIFCQSARRHISECSNLHSQSRECLKSYFPPKTKSLLASFTTN